MCASQDTSLLDTLLLVDSEEERCPNHGRYKMHGCQENGASFYFGCTARHQLVMNKDCRPDAVGMSMLVQSSPAIVALSGVKTGVTITGFDCTYFVLLSSM